MDGANKKFHLSVITPEKAILETEATFVALPAYDGEVGILANRAPLLTKLGVGWLRAETPGGEKEYLLDGGFAQVVDNKVSVLTEKATPRSEVARQDARQALEAAQALQIEDQASFEARQHALELARAQARA